MNGLTDYHLMEIQLPVTKQSVGCIIPACMDLLILEIGQFGYIQKDSWPGIGIGGSMALAIQLSHDSDRL